MIDTNLAKDCPRQYIPGSLIKLAVHVAVPSGTELQKNNEYHIYEDTILPLPDLDGLEIGDEIHVLQLGGTSTVTYTNRNYVVKSPSNPILASKVIFKVISLDGVKMWTQTSVAGTVDVIIRIKDDTNTSGRTILDIDLINVDNVHVVMEAYNPSDALKEDVILATTDETAGKPIKFYTLTSGVEWNIVSALYRGISVVGPTRFAITGTQDESDFYHIPPTVENSHASISLSSIPYGDGTVIWFPINIEGDWRADGDVQLDILNI